MKTGGIKYGEEGCKECDLFKLCDPFYEKKVTSTEEKLPLTEWIRDRAAPRKARRRRNWKSKS